jgi:hypothetical protein
MLVEGPWYFRLEAETERCAMAMTGYIINENEVRLSDTALLLMQK